ncbi:MAG: hypothetical protein ACREJM_08105, partial [Candidatus Saccharimonadales bacterium]
SDSVNYRAFQVMEFERNQVWFDPREVLAGTIFDRTDKDSLERMRSADFAVLTEIPPPEAGVYELPFDRDMHRVTPDLMAWCRKNMIELQSGLVQGRDVNVFIRPAVRVQAEPNGWIARHGATVVSLAQILRQKPTIELWGPSSKQQLPTPPHVQAELTIADHPPMQVPAELKYERSAYHLTLKLDPAKLPEVGKVTIELSFDPAVVPRTTSGRNHRELVFKLPDRAELH